MQAFITELESLVTKTDSKSALAALPKIIENICNLINYLSSASKGEVSKSIKALQQVLHNILAVNFGESTNEYLIARIISSLYIKIMAACDTNQNQTIISNIFHILLSSKSKLSQKLITIATLNGILKNNKEIVDFPRGMLQDMFQNLLKLVKSVHETSIRLGAINCMRLLIKMKLALSTANTQEVMKLLLRYIAEKTEELKLCCARTLLSFLNHSPWTDSLAYYEQICSLCTKIVGDNVTPDLKRQLTFCFTKVNIMKFIKGLDVHDKSKKHAKTAAAPVAESADKVTDLIHSFNSMYLKEENLRHFALEYLYLGLIYFKKEIRVTHLNVLLNSLWNLFKKTSAEYASKNEKYFSKFMENLSVLLTQELKFAFLQIVLETLKSKAVQKVPGEEDSVRANALNVKDNSVRAAQFQFLLKTFIDMVESLGSILGEKYSHASHLLDPLTPYLSYNHIEIQLAAAYAFQYVVDAYGRERPQAVSKLLNLMTWARGEIATAQVDFNSKDALNGPVYQLNTVRGSSLAISLLVQNIDFDIKPLPFDITNLVFDHAKSILTENVVEDASIQKLLDEGAGYLGLGWLILGEMTSLEYHWVGSRIKILFDLWKNLFMVDDIQAQSEADLRKKLSERVYAFKSIRKFSNNCKKLQSEAILKVVGTFICNFTSLVLSNLAKNPFSQNIKKNDNEVLDAKMEIYRCANLVNPIYYPSKFNLILQTAIEDVANFLNEEIYFITKKQFPFMEYDIAYLLDFGPKFFKILYGLEDIYDFEERGTMIFDFDISQSFFSKYLKNSKTTLVKEQLKFIGDAFVSQVFTHKNKMQLLKFLASNVKNSHSAKDPFLRIQKLYSLLIITLSIVHKIYNETNKGEEVEMEMLEVFREICESSWTFVNNHARITCALIYAMLFKLSKSTDFQDALMRNLYDGLSDPIKAPTISVVVGCIFKFHPQMDQKLFIQLVNIFQKSSRNQDGTNAIWLINSLRLGLEHAPDYARDLIKACLPFLMRYHYENKTSGRVSFIAWCYLVEILTKRINSLKIERMYHIDALVVDLDNTDFVIPDNFLKDAKLTLASAILNNQQLNTQIKLKYTRYLVKMLHNPTRAGKVPRLPDKAFELTQSIVERGDLDQINLFDSKFNQIYLDEINLICNKRDPEIEKIEKVYHRFLTVQLQLLKLKQSSFEDQLKFFKECVFPEQEHLQDGENKEEKPASSVHIGKIEFNKDYSIALKTRVYAMKCIENLLQYTNVQTFKARDVVNFATLIIPFVFKVASSPFEETKEMGMKVFHSLLSKLLNFSETGEDLNAMVEGEKTPLMLQYGAQIDSLIRFNIKDINENSAISVQSSLKLFSKFFKLMYRDDFTMVKRLFVLIISGIQGPIKLSQSSNHSEKALTEIHFTRVRILCKVFQYFKENMQKEEVLRNEYEGLFPPLLKKFLEQNLAAILEDSALVVMFSRRVLKNYENFHFIYNGTKISYDSKSVFSNLPIFISTYLILIRENPPSADLIKALPDGEMKKYLQNNQKLIPQNQALIQICLLLCNFLLTHNEVYENANEANKRMKKLSDYNVLKVFKEKIIALKSLQIMLSDEATVTENRHLFIEMLNILNNYMTLANPDLNNEIFKIYLRALAHQSLNDTFEIIATSITLFYYTAQQDILANPEPWVDTIILLLNIVKILIFKLCTQHQQHDLTSRLSFFLKLILTYIFSGSPRLQIESIRIFKQIFETLMSSEQTKATVGDSLEKFISLIINKVNDGNVQPETKIRLIDLLLSIEQIFKKDKTIFEEATIFISRDCDLVKVYLINLRNIWRTTKQIPLELVPRVFSLIKCSIEQMQSAKALANQHNELIAEILKMFLYLQLEGPNVNKQVLAEALLGLFVIIVELQLNPTTSAILTQVIQHIYSTLQPIQVKQMLSTLNENQRNTLCGYSPALKTINEQNFDSQQTNVSSTTNTQGTGEKATIKLKAFGKK